MDLMKINEEIRLQDEELVSVQNIPSYIIDVRGASGTFTITFGGQTTSDLTIGAPAATVQSALDALSSVGSGNSTVTGIFPYYVVFDASLSGLATPTVNTSGLSALGTAPATTAGTTSAQIYTEGSSPAAVYTHTSGWTTESAPDVSDYVLQATGTGVQSFEIQIPSLVTGVYNVYYTFSQPNSGDLTVASTIPYHFFDGDTYSHSVIINQNYQGFAYNGVGFYDLGIALTQMYITSGTLKIMISDQVQSEDIGNYIIVRGFALSPANPTGNVVSNYINPYSVLPFGGTGTAADYGGWNNREDSVLTTGDTYQWGFSPLYPGVWDIQSDWVSSNPHDPDGIYQVYDLLTPVGSSTILNQNINSTGGQTLVGPSTNSITFQDFGNFTITSNQASLLYTASSSVGGSVTGICDASLITLVAAAVPNVTVYSAVTEYGNPIIGTISLATNAGVDTITYPAPTAVANAIGGVSLYVGSSSGGESGTAYATNDGTGSGTFTHATGSFYIVKAFDTADTPNYSAPSNEVFNLVGPSISTISIATNGTTDTISYPIPTAGTYSVGGVSIYVGSTSGGESGTAYATNDGTGSGTFTHATGNYYKVKAFDTDGTPNYSTASNEVHSITVPTIGSISIATNGTTDTITYPAPTAGQNSVSGVSIYVGTTSGGESGTAYATNSGTGSGTFTHATGKYYEVKAFDVDNNYSTASNEVHSITVPTIGTISIVTNGSTDTITYPMPTAGTNTVSGVSIYVGSTSGGESGTAYATNSGTGSGTFTHATGKYYEVKAFDVDNNYSIVSNEVQSVTVPTIGTISIVTNEGTDTISYPAPTAGTNSVGGVSLYVGSMPGEESGTAYATNDGTGSGTFTHATGNYYIVKAFDVDSNYSLASNEVFAITSPTIGTISLVSNSNIDTISYPAPTAGSLAVGGVSIYVGSSSGGESGTAYATNDGTGSGTFTHAIGSYYKVKAFDEADNYSTASNEVHSVTVPTIGTISIVTDAGTDTISYPAPTAGTNSVGGVSLYVGNSSGEESGTATTTNDGTGSGTFTHATGYFYIVKAFDTSDNTSLASNEVNGITLPVIGTISISTNGSIDTITYPMPTAGTNSVGGVSLYVGTSSGSESGTAYATNDGTGSGTFTHSGGYFYIVKVFDVDSNYSFASNEVQTIAIPTIGTISIHTNGTTDTISYPAPTAGTNSISGVSLYVGTSSGSESDSAYATVSSSSSGTFTHATGNFYYIVKTFDIDENYSASSNEVHSITVPTIGTIYIHTNNITDTIGYPVPTAGQNSVGGVSIYVGSSSGSESTSPYNTNSGTGAGTFTHATGNYYYKIKAFDTSNNYSSLSNEVNSVSLPINSSNISIITNDDVDTISYPVPTAGAYTIAGASIYVGTSPGGESGTAYATNLGTGSGTFTHVHGTYYYKIQFFDVQGNFSAPSNEVTGIIVPTIGTITITTLNNIDTISYPAPGMGANSVSGVSLYVGKSSGEESSSAYDTNSGTSSGTFTHVSDFNNYYIVKAFDTQGNYSDDSNEVTTVVASGGPTVGTLSIVTNDTIDTLTYTAPIAGIHSITGVSLYVSLTSEGETYPAYATNSGGGTGTFTHNIAPNGTTGYYYVIKVYDSVGNYSVYSNEVNGGFFVLPFPGSSKQINTNNFNTPANYFTSSGSSIGSAAAIFKKNCPNNICVIN